MSNWYDIDPPEQKGSNESFYKDSTLRTLRILKMPFDLTPTDLDGLRQIAQRMRGDGYVNSKSSRDQLFKYGLIDRWNGFNFITKAGIITLDCFEMLKDSGEISNSIINKGK